MYKQNIPEHARTIRNIHNGLTSGQKLFFGPTRSWGEPCGQAAFKRGKTTSVRSAPRLEQPMVRNAR